MANKIKPSLKKKISSGVVTWVATYTAPDGSTYHCSSVTAERAMKMWYRKFRIKLGITGGG